MRPSLFSLFSATLLSLLAILGHRDLALGHHHKRQPCLLRADTWPTPLLLRPLLTRLTSRGSETPPMFSPSKRSERATLFSKFWVVFHDLWSPILMRVRDFTLIWRLIKVFYIWSFWLWIVARTYLSEIWEVGLNYQWFIFWSKWMNNCRLLWGSEIFSLLFDGFFFLSIHSFIAF